jgi:hypothetical protein
MLAEQIMAAMAAGKSLEEALSSAIPVGSDGKVGTSRKPEEIKALDDLQELRRIRKVAFAKISKGTKNKATMDNYVNEKVVASERIAEILATIKKAEHPWVVAKAYNEDASGILQFFLDEHQDNLNKIIDKAVKGKLSKAGVKALIARSPMTATLVPEELKAAFLERAAKFDQRVVTLARMNGLIDQLRKPKAQAK